MRKALAAALLAAGMASSVRAAPECLVPTGEYLPTQVPYTYILDRSNVFEPDYLERLRVGPPYLLENGDLTAGHPYFGPMCDLGALRAGKPEPSAEEFVARYRQKRAATPDYVKKAHAVGVKLVTAYVCMMTTGGDHEKRTGFWRFYDNWDSFREFHIPPRPGADPEQWLQRKPDGSPHYFYAHEHPPYKPMVRYANCVNNPGWRAYMQWLIEEAARVGLDGVFVDNAESQRCYCKLCQAGFEKWLRSRYSAQEIKDVFGGDVSLQADVSKGDLRLAETRLFWQASIRAFLADIKRWGAAIHGSFFVFPNGLHGRSHNIAVVYPDCDLAMDENSVGVAGTHPGVAKSHIIAGLHVTRVNDNLLSYRYAAGAGAGCRTNLLCRPGYPKSDQANFGANANVGALGIAEAAAFGGGGCYLHGGPKSAPWLAAVRATYNEFFEKNAGLYKGMFPFGQAGVIAFVLPNYFGDRSAFSSINQGLHLLAERHVLADLIPERVFTLEWIKRYPALVVPNIAIMSDAQVAALVSYAKSGGKLIVLGEKAATRDQFGREREPSGVQNLLNLAVSRYGSDPSEAFATGQPLHGSELCSQDAAPLVRFAAYVNHPSQPTALVLHCVNYDVDLGLKHDRVGAVRDLELAIPLPPQTKPINAVFKAPGEADVPLRVEQIGDRARVRVPKLSIYGLVRLLLERSGG